MALRLLCRLGARRIRASGLLAPNDFRGFREAGAWDEISLERAVADMAGGLTELCCHPGADDGIGERFPWGYGWETELAALSSAEVKGVLAETGVRLTTYRECLENGNASGERARASVAEERA